MLVTVNLTPGESVYGEKRIVVQNAVAPAANANGEVPPPTSVEYRVWNPFRSKLAAGIIGGMENIYMFPGAKVLYLGAASGTSVSHVADLVGKEGTVYAVEFSHRSGRDLVNMATHRTNVIPIVEDARHPMKYRMLVSMVDCIFAGRFTHLPVSRFCLIFLRCCPTRSSSYRRIERTSIPQGRRRCCCLHQGQLYRQYRSTRGSLRPRSREAESRVRNFLSY
jgi:hypothetical protein